MASFKFCNYKVLDSTNSKAIDLAKKGLHGIVVMAERQTKGKGRFKRQWSSQTGGIYMTIVLKIRDIGKTKYLTFAAAVSTAKTIRKITGLNALVKWPNDILIDGKKACGILTETISGKENYAVVGIGLNVNQEKFPKNIASKSTSLFLKTSKLYNIKKISREILKEFNKLYSQYKNNNHEKIIAEWKRHSHTLGRKIKAKTMNKTYTGKAVGIDEECSLLLRLNSGKIKKITEGDIFAV